MQQLRTKSSTDLPAILQDRRDHLAMVDVVPDRVILAGIVESVGPEVPGVGVEDGVVVAGDGAQSGQRVLADEPLVDGQAMELRRRADAHRVGHLVQGRAQADVRRTEPDIAVDVALRRGLRGIEKHGVGLHDADRVSFVKAHRAVHGIGDAAVGVGPGGRGVRVAMASVTELAAGRAGGSGKVEETQLDAGFAVCRDAGEQDSAGLANKHSLGPSVQRASLRVSPWNSSGEPGPG